MVASRSCVTVWRYPKSPTTGTLFEHPTASNAWNRRSSPKRRSLLASLQDASIWGNEFPRFTPWAQAIAPPASGATQSAFFPEHFVRFRIGSLGSFVKISPEPRAAFDGGIDRKHL